MGELRWKAKMGKTRERGGRKGKEKRGGKRWEGKG